MFLESDETIYAALSVNDLMFSKDSQVLLEDPALSAFLCSFSFFFLWPTQCSFVLSSSSKLML